MNMAYDSLNFARKLKRLGVSEKQAEAHAQVLAEFKESHLAAKTDVELIRSDVKNSETSIRSDMKTMEASIRSDIKSDMKDMKYSLMIEINDKFHDSKMFTGIMMSTATTILFLALKFFD